MSENVLNLLGAMSGEFDAKAKHPVLSSLCPRYPERIWATQCVLG